LERYSARTIDELGRLSIHSELRQRLGTEAGNKLSLKIVDTIIILQKVADDTTSDYTVCTISDIGMFEVPKEIRQTLGWNVKDKIAVYHIDNILILKSVGEI